MVAWIRALPWTAERPSAGLAVLTKLRQDKVVWGLLAGLALLAALDAPQLPTTVAFTGEAMISMAPFFLLAVAMGGYAKATGADALIARAFSGNPAVAIAGAALVGALSPFCSCGVIPLIAAMLLAGVPLAPVMAFWIASPVMDPEMFVLTTAGIGLSFTIAKTFAAIGMGLFAGFVTLVVQRLGGLHNPLSPAYRPSGCGSGFGDAAAVTWRFWTDPERRAAFLDECATNGWFLGKWLAFAFFLESLMVAYIPADWVASYVGGDQWFAIPLAAIIGIPSYLNGYAAIPVLAGLLDMGMSPGAAMTFITSGAATSMPAAIAVFALVRKPVFAVYVLLALTGAVLSGYAYQLSGGVV